MLAVIVMVTKRWTNTCTGPDSKAYKKVANLAKANTKDSTEKARAKVKVKMTSQTLAEWTTAKTTMKNFALSAMSTSARSTAGGAANANTSFALTTQPIIAASRQDTVASTLKKQHHSTRNSSSQNHRHGTEGFAVTQHAATRDTTTVTILAVSM